jgi:hypothetical protein
MMNHKGQIELSANFIIIIVISVVVLAGGFTIFYKMIHNAQETVTALDGQTQEKIKNMMLDNQRTAVYPSELTMNSNDPQMIGVGITNIFEADTTFNVRLIDVKLYNDANPDGTDVANTPDVLKDYYDIISENIAIKPQDKGVKGMLLKLPQGSLKGQFVYTINITNSSIYDYGVVQVIVNNK